jgi:hypothetical protein
MSYEVLVVIAVINGIATILLWQQVAAKANQRLRLNKKAEDAVWRSEPIEPRHDPPKVVGGGFPLANDVDRAFFEDFKEFADVVNWSLADKFTPSPFRLQDMPDGTVSIDYIPDGRMDPIPGRCFALYYNQTRVGRLEIHPRYNYTTETPQVYTSAQIDKARLIGSRTLTGFLSAIADHISDRGQMGDRRREIWETIQYALTETLWNKYLVEYSPSWMKIWILASLTRASMARRSFISSAEARGLRLAGRTRPTPELRRNS